MVSDIKCGLIVLVTKETGATTRPMVRVVSFMLTETFMKENGKMTRRRVRVLIPTRMALSTKDNGRTTNSMEWELRAGLMAQDTKAIIKTEKRKGQAN